MTSNPAGDILRAIVSRKRVANRVAAKMIDLSLIVSVALLFPYPLGPFLGFAYSLLADGMSFGPFQGQSVGKWLVHLQVRSLVRGAPANIRDSALRNAPVGVATFFAIIPIWGWLILGLIGIPLMIMEIYLMVTVEAGHRLGDVMADTEVVEFKATTKV
ncbi:MAG: hypothetical protein A2X94_01345 [Bdellovibrionales bacterium GWB1_55_8]|nr:MAG: hypothetical protein A2X94_01345 [Bdellovibrionales bacterium GWB1_55_8]